MREGGLPGRGKDDQARHSRGPMKKITLIEDDGDIAFTIRLNLEREGYVVTHFARGQDGLLAVQRGGADFVILDLNLPDLEGLTLCRELRRDPRTPAIPIGLPPARGPGPGRAPVLRRAADAYHSKTASGP